MSQEIKYIKVKITDVLDGIVPSKIESFSKLEGLNLNPTDDIADKTISYIIGDYYYILARFYSFANKSRFGESTEEELKLINEFVSKYNLSYVSQEEFQKINSVEEL